MAEITTNGYEDLKYLIQENWTRISLRDEEGNEVYGATTSGSAEWIHPTESKPVEYDMRGYPIPGDVPSTQTLSLQVVVSGSQVSLPATFASSVITNQLSEVVSEETFTPFEMTQTEDQLTITHNIEVPQVTG